MASATNSPAFSIAFNSLLDRIHKSVLEREAVFTAQRRFVADAGHELRTPLTSIRGYARMLNEWGLQDEKVARESVEVIERESARLHDLAEGLLTVARGDEQAAPELADGRSAHSGRGNDRSHAGQHQYVPASNRSFPIRPVLAQIDDPGVRQLVTILIDNAIKYSPTGSTVTVTVAMSGGRPNPGCP